MKRKIKLASIALAVAGTYWAAGAMAQDTISDDVVRIGVLTDMSGQFSHEAGEGAVTAVKMAVEDFGSVVLGKPIEVVVSDHLNKPDVGATRAREWFDTQQVDMITNLINSAVALAVTNVAQEKNGIAIVNGSGSSRLTGDACTPNSIHYSYDTYALATGTAKVLLEKGLDSWFFLTADYAFGHSLEKDATTIVEQNGGEVIGSIRYPVESSDHSSFLLQAQASKAQVVALAGSGVGFINAMKAANEFGLTHRGQNVAGLLVWDTDVDAMGLEQAQGLILTNAFYWDRTPETREWSKRFYERMKRMPHMGDAGDYSSTLHYLKAIEAAGTDEASAVMAKMKELPINDFFAEQGRIREDGRMVHDMYVYQVKSPEESQYDWDYLKLLEVIPAEDAFLPLSASECPLLS